MSDPAIIRPLVESGDTVTLRRVDHVALLREAEDTADAARIRDIEARFTAGPGRVRANRADPAPDGGR